MEACFYLSQAGLLGVRLQERARTRAQVEIGYDSTQRGAVLHTCKLTRSSLCLIELRFIRPFQAITSSSLPQGPGASQLEKVVML